MPLPDEVRGMSGLDDAEFDRDEFIAEMRASIRAVFSLPKNQRCPSCHSRLRIDKEWADEWACLNPDCNYYETVSFHDPKFVRKLVWQARRSKVRRFFADPTCRYLGHKWRGERKFSACRRCGLTRFSFDRMGEE